ncbi:hypothetical protein [Phytoactinopolyspora mesophila]|uniref:Uncharacterized protein n=1 Tax=Phytoactinopolyspora mesophila TaxID=2650750 RepID=A0A7K3MC41_9ACTN|nr:hypothetical protein [Phytoactinopolyspora mesophila]NDL60836.1 hypothetical protein [Phytoactinopolyspora mesophila]
MLAELEPVASGVLSSFPAWRARRGREAKADALRAKAAALAGPAALAFDAAGVSIDYKPPGTWQQQPINPALVWSTMFGNTPMLDPSLVNQVGLQALGLLEHKGDEQAEREKGFVGAIAWFLTLGPRIRAAAGLPPRSAPGLVVTSVVVLVQGILIAAVGGVLVFPLAGWLGWLPD